MIDKLSLCLVITAAVGFSPSFFFFFYSGMAACMYIMVIWSLDKRDTLLSYEIYYT